MSCRGQVSVRVGSTYDGSIDKRECGYASRALSECHSKVVLHGQSLEFRVDGCVGTHLFSFLHERVSHYRPCMICDFKSLLLFDIRSLPVYQ